MKKIFFLLLLCIVHLAACSSTKVTGVWQDKNYGGPAFKNVLVVSLFLDQEVGRMSELQLARQLQQKGVSASSGQVVLPAGRRSSVEAITGAIGEQAFDGILISRIVDRMENTRVTAQGTCDNRWESDYRQNQRYSLSPCNPGLSTTTPVYALETNLYSTQSGALVISLKSATTVDRPTEDLIKGFVKSVVARLSSAGLLVGQ